MHGRATKALLTIRQKVDHGQSLSHAEWMFVAHFVQLGTESSYKNPLRPGSWSGLLEAFRTLYSVRLEGPDRSGYYLSHLAGQTLEREPGDVRSAVMSLLERVRGEAKVHPSVGRALYGLLAGERFSNLASVQAALLPYWPVLWRVAARGHYGQRKVPIHKEETWEEMQERHSESNAPDHREAIPPFLAGDYRLTVAESIDGDTLSLLLSLPGDHGPMYTMSQYPKIAELLAMLEGLGPRTVARGNVSGIDRNSEIGALQEVFQLVQNNQSGHLLLSGDQKCNRRRSQSQRLQRRCIVRCQRCLSEAVIQSLLR